MSWEKQLKLYDELVELCPDIDRKGKTVPYTSANGYMFSLLNKEGEFGIRLSKEEGEKFKEKFKTKPFKSHGAFMRGYVLIPNKLFRDMPTLAQYLKNGHQYVLSLPPK